MKVWQGCALAVGVFVLFVGAIIGAVFWATGGITDTADEFFAATNAGDYETAHTLVSQRLQNSGSPDELGAFIEDAGLGDVADTSWSNRSIENSTGELTGTVTTGSGGTIPLTILFVSENDEWRIDGFDIQTGGFSTGASGAGDAEEP